MDKMHKHFVFTVYSQMYVTSCSSLHLIEMLLLAVLLLAACTNAENADAKQDTCTAGSGEHCENNGAVCTETSAARVIFRHGGKCSL
jgi:ABC-type Fe3+-citrate transport system substrate-binding protein